MTKALAWAAGPGWGEYFAGIDEMKDWPSAESFRRRHDLAFFEGLAALLLRRR